MKVLDAAPFNPPKTGAIDVEFRLVFSGGGPSGHSGGSTPPVPFVKANAYLDPGADIVYVLDDWLVKAVASWGQVRPFGIDRDGMLSGVEYEVKIKGWKRVFNFPVQVRHHQPPGPCANRPSGWRHINTLPMAGTEDLLLGAPFLLPLMLVYHGPAMTLIDPDHNSSNAKLARNIRDLLR